VIEVIEKILYKYNKLDDDKSFGEENENQQIDTVTSSTPILKIPNMKKPKVTSQKHVEITEFTHNEAIKTDDDRNVKEKNKNQRQIEKSAPTTSTLSNKIYEVKNTIKSDKSSDDTNIIIDNDENGEREEYLNPLKSISGDINVIVPKDSKQRQIIFDKIAYNQSIKLFGEGMAVDENRKIMENETPSTSMLLNVSNDSSQIVDDEVYDQNAIMFNDNIRTMVEGYENRRTAKNTSRGKWRKRFSVFARYGIQEFSSYFLFIIFYPFFVYRRIRQYFSRQP